MIIKSAQHKMLFKDKEFDILDSPIFQLKRYNLYFAEINAS